MAKKEEIETKEEVAVTNKIEFRTHNEANFVGFVHPKTRKLVTVDEDGKLFIDETDTAAIEILTAAKDVFKA